MKNFLKIIMVFSVLLLGVADSHAQMIQVKGSDTLINLVQKLAEEYMMKNPGKNIAVTGGGSGTGVAALLNNKCDIANASREMSLKEYEQASDRGITPVTIVVALDGLSIIVNPDNSVEELTKDQVAKIFRGEIRNWSEVGGKDMPVNLYGRQSNSGTYEFMKTAVLKGDFSGKMSRMNGNAQIVAAVQADESGIGYVGVGYVKDSTGIKVLNIALKEGGEYASPLDKIKVDTGIYPLSRPLYQFVNGNPQGDVKEFIAFELSPEGQRIVEEEGFFSIPQEYVGLNKKAGL
ncbi:MAG: phosphate ABC transporter substrate-binding protein [Candidatus Omnitrophica bacterium]|nr:phosphate ABC transporter substrate-binding protein [Candidatus Omnitrophota bacterium]